MLQIDGDVYLDVREASDRLGVKPETLYAYVSRGLIKSYRQGVRRRRLYLAHEIELLLALQPSKSEPPLESPLPAAGAQPSAAPDTSAQRSHDIPPEGQLHAADGWATER